MDQKDSPESPMSSEESEESLQHLRFHCYSSSPIPTFRGGHPAMDDHGAVRDSSSTMLGSDDLPDDSETMVPMSSSPVLSSPAAITPLSVLEDPEIAVAGSSGSLSPSQEQPSQQHSLHDSRHLYPGIKASKRSVFDSSGDPQGAPRRIQSITGSFAVPINSTFLCSLSIPACDLDVERSRVSAPRHESDFYTSPGFYHETALTQSLFLEQLDNLLRAVEYERENHDPETTNDDLLGTASASVASSLGTADSLGPSLSPEPLEAADNVTASYDGIEHSSWESARSSVLGKRTRSTKDHLVQNSREARAYSHSESPSLEPSHFGKRRKVCTVESRFFHRETLQRLADKTEDDVQPEVSTDRPKQRIYAQRLASLRRADSLRSDATTQDSEENGARKAAPQPALEPVSPTYTPSSSCTPGTYIPTEPATPVVSRKFQRGSFSRTLSPWPEPLPVVAPPPFELIPRAPLSAEDAAEVRVRILLAKERAQRDTDGLFDTKPVVTSFSANTQVVADDNTKITVDDTPSVEGSGGYDADDESDCSAIGHDDEARLNTSPLRQRPTVEARFSRPCPRLGIKDCLKKEIIEWMLDVVPHPPPSEPHCGTNIRNQLRISPETRFHAVYMFLRFFMRLGPSPSSSQNTDGSANHGREAVSWDIAVACLTMSVKFHRDTLPPLFPTCADEFMELAPEAISYDDLETAQRDVFEALDFTLGSATPESFMQELRLALPSLRTLLSAPSSWDDVRAEAWAMLFEAVLQPDVLRFPISLLTACALFEGAVKSLETGRQNEAKPRNEREKRQDDRRKKVNMQKANNVLLDMEELLGYSPDEVQSCRDWLSAMANAV
ncbi:hypothetical protein CERSUDRAFT_124037 [Gelatoporia subvermispora B]|uniref:Uncharacterized protein n=1 Tax=Ceriporiopsis subvermispora (strain B) TaxID=914234 RepID=M2PL74_CERS8|nr:hypothetical protein CERSUDRAFT_124037 [Gelatoporia subvermispora B]